MSGPDKADQDKGFLARWSQRKQEAKRPDSGQDTPIADDDAASAGPPVAQGESVSEQEFDLSTLPKLEELTETTDITAFLRKGVPEHLKNAALRKSWALDPAIRNYVNPALEYAYDWNTPGGVPGSSELGAGVDVARLVSQIMGGESAAESAANPDANSGNEAATSPGQLSERDLSSKLPQDTPVQSLRPVGEAAPETEGGVSKAEGGADEPAPDAESAESQVAHPAAPQQPVRRHGTAKPIV
jgi:hypothetical protein